MRARNEPARNSLALFSKSCFTKQIELRRSLRIRVARGNASLVTLPVTDCVALLEAFERAGTPRHVDGRLKWREMRMNTMKALLVAGGALGAALGSGAITTPAHAQG